LFFSFILKILFNTYDNTYWNTENPLPKHAVPLHNVKIGVWYALTARTITGLVFYVTMTMIMTSPLNPS
jgi:hypothetical protein